MRGVLSVASECAPLVKTGGLADVAGALPGALAGQGWRMRTLVPGYPAVLAALQGAETVLSEGSLMGGPARVLAGTAAGLDLMVVEAPHLWDRAGSIYLGPDGADWPDNPERFAALSWMAARIGAEGAAGWVPEVIQCHDWQAGFTPVYLRAMGAAGRVGTVMTVHNIAFHGPAPADRLRALRLPPAGFTPEGFEYWGGINALKAGLTAADRLTTVSPTYARELLDPFFGMGLDGLLRARAGVLSGILNGIDTSVWDPASDLLVTPYRDPRGKARNRAALAAEAGLSAEGGPLCVVISRLTGQKGLDLLLGALPALLERGGSLALLGSGEPGLEAAFRAAAARHPDRVHVSIGYDEVRAHRLLAGGDAILIPSRFEPCGLTQMMGLRYGTIPVVARTGGLADTVIHANEAALRAGVATGLVVRPGSVEALAEGLADLCTLWAGPHLASLRRNAMRHPVGWEVSAEAYAALFAAVAKG